MPSFSEKSPVSISVGDSISRLLSAQYHNRLIDDIVDLKKDYSRNVPFPTVNLEYVGEFLAVVKASSDYTQEVYALTRHRIATGTESGTPISTEVDWAIPTGEQVVEATNLAELATHSHLVRVGTVVKVWAFIDPVTGYYHHYFNAFPPTLIPVKIEFKSGSDGSLTTKASYLYTVRTLDNKLIADDVPVVRQRPYGKMTYVGSGYGLGFYDGGDFKLWDAGEVPTTTTCSAP